MPNLQRYSLVSMDHDHHHQHHRTNGELIRVKNISLWKQIYRRYFRGFFCFPINSWSYNRLVITLVTFAIFMLFSTHLYVSLSQYQIDADLASSRGEASVISDAFSARIYNYKNRYSVSATRRFPLPFFDSSAQMETARQIDRTLEKIEQSLQENRAILKQIRANIHSAELRALDTATSNNNNNNNRDDNLAKVVNARGDDVKQYFDSIRLKDHLFYPTPNPSIADSQALYLSVCENIRLSSSTDTIVSAKSMPNIDMEAVYDENQFDNHDGGSWKQGWEISAPAADFAADRHAKLKIFIVPHSHNDPGWVKTFDSYFREQTKQILTNAVEQLNRRPDMRFIWAEASYLSAWWETAPTERHRDSMKRLIKDGRLELVTGGWVMNDEANTHYSAMLTQMIEGHEWLADTFDFKIRTAWAIDPFGMSSTMAYLLKRMNIEGMVVQRVHYSIKKYLAQRKQLEFRWRQPWESPMGSVDDDDDILTHVEPFYSYDVPHTCGPDPAICCQFDFKRLPGTRVKCPWKISPKAITDDNVAERANTLLAQYRKKSQLYKTSSLLIPLGDDFRYDKAKEWIDQYSNYKKLMDYMNANAEMNVEIKFATLSDYFASIFNETGKNSRHNSSSSSLARQFPSLTGDFFTYSDRDDHYWSGYYTSKPFYKRFERVLATHLRATEILFSLANIISPKLAEEDSFKNLMNDFIFARQNFALFQHHDGITGTAKDFVVRDYAKRMHKAFTILEKVTSHSIGTISANAIGQDPPAEPPLPLEFMNRFHDEETPLRQHVFALNSSSKNYFVLYNSLGWRQESQLYCFDITWTESGNTDHPASSMPIDWCLVNVASGNIIDDLQINHRWQGDALITGTREVCFQPSLEPISLHQYCVGNCSACGGSHAPTLKTLYQKKESFVTLYNYHQKPDATVPADSHILALMAPAERNVTIENERISLLFDLDNGQLSEVGLLNSVSSGGEKWNRFRASLQLMTYGTVRGGKNVQKSGAYLFIPDAREAKSWQGVGKPKLRVTSGRLESRFELIYSDPLPIYIRFSLSRGRRSIDLQTEFLLSGLYAANKELLLRFDIPAIDNRDRFYTDLNGFQMTARKWYDKIPLQGNVYPLNTMAFIERNDAGRSENDSRQKNLLRFNILTGQPLGVTSAKSGQLDIFLDRRLTQDDARGLNQGVTDNKRTRETFRLLFESPLAVAASPATPLLTSGAIFESQSLLNPPIGITGSGTSGSPILAPHASRLVYLKHSLPCDLHLLNLRRATKRPAEFGLLLHRFGVSCDSACVVRSGTSTSTTANTISVSDIFVENIAEKFDRDRVIPHTLSFLEPLSSTDRSIHFAANLSINPMEIAAYKIFLRK